MEFVQTLSSSLGKSLPLLDKPATNFSYSKNNNLHFANQLSLSLKLGSTLSMRKFLMFVLRRITMKSPKFVNELAS